MSEFQSVGRSSPGGPIRVDPRAVEIFDAEWEALRCEQEPAPVPVIQQIQITPTVATARIEVPKPVEAIPDSPLVRAARNYAQASAFLESAQEKLLNTQRVHDQAVESKRKAHEALKQAVAAETQEISNGT
jgi:hypothetical protein